MTHPGAVNQSKDVEFWISSLLRLGVVTSLILLAIGMAMSFWHHPDYLWSPTELKGLTGDEAAFPRSASGVWDSLANFHGQGVVISGLWVLIATPIMRVAASTLMFWREKDRTFTGITLAVLSLLILSLVLGKTGH